jgi:hypothetical protein
VRKADTGRKYTRSGPEVRRVTAMARTKLTARKTAGGKARKVVGGVAPKKFSDNKAALKNPRGKRP